VLGQQITVKGATQILGRLVTALGPNLSERVGQPGLTHAFPRPQAFTPDALAPLGITRARVTSLAGVATAAQRDPRLFEPRRDLAEAVDRLRELPGIGPWSAQYIAMRALGECDAFPAGDVGFQRSFALCGQPCSETALTSRAARWRPWRAYAAVHLWMSDGDTQTVSASPQIQKEYHRKEYQQKEYHHAVSA
jgi:3-methyladenine DNA glycosylase/8-oxoguanine DNA glycosylase